jgi:hypothetical protein
MNVSKSQPLNVIAWVREPALPGLGRLAYNDTSFTWHDAIPGRLSGFEAHDGTYYRAFGADNVLRQSYKFNTMLPEDKQPQALADAKQAAELIAASPNLAKLREVDADTFFFGDPEVTPGRGKLLIQRGDDRHYLIGDLADMPDVAGAAKQIARSLIAR